MPKAPTTLTIEEMNVFVKQILARNGTETLKRKASRNYLMALLMLQAGLRVGEVCALIVADLFFQDAAVQTLRVRKEITKGKCERLIPLTKHIQSYIGIVRLAWWSEPIVTNSSFAFYAVEPTHPLTTRQVERIINRAGLDGLGRKVNPHMLRHTFASRLMRTTNARIVQELLGHKNLTTTQIYTHPNGDDLKNAIDSIQ